MMVSIPSSLFLLGLAHSIQSSYSFSPSIYTVSPRVASSLDMIRNRGLERREEGASPLRKFMMCGWYYYVYGVCNNMALILRISWYI